MQATITQNFLNCLNAYNYSKQRGDETNVPTVFSNASNVDEGLNVISMSTGTLANSIYSRTSNPANQKLYRLARNGELTGGNQYGSTPWGFVYNFDLTKTNIYDVFFDEGIVKPESMLRPTLVGSLFGTASSDTPTFRVIPMLCTSSSAITLETTDSDGDIVIPASVETLTTTYNEDKSITVVYRIAIPANVASFTIRSVLFTGAYAAKHSSGSSSDTTTLYNATTYPPVILWGAVLDEAIEAEASDAIKLTVTYKTNYQS